MTTGGQTAADRDVESLFGDGAAGGLTVAAKRGIDRVRVRAGAIAA